MKPLSRYLLVLLATILCHPLWAEEPQAPAAETRPEATAEKDDNRDTRKKDATVPAPAVEFDPSEEISEDLSVPFPVDI